MPENSSTLDKDSPEGVIFALAVLVLGAMSFFATTAMMVAGINYFMLLAGYLLRKGRPALHPVLMTIGALSDLALVLVLEIQRHAIDTALSFKLSFFQQAHILFSSLASFLYLPVLMMGIVLMARNRRGDSSSSWRHWHPRLGACAFTFRSIGFLLMFSMLKK